MPRTQKIWGQSLHTFSYHMLLSGAHCYDELSDLRCYTLSDADYTLSAPIEVTCVEFRNGQLTPVTRTVRGERITKVDWTLALPQSYTMWSEIQFLAETECRRDIILCLLCPERPEYDHFIRLKDVIFGAIQRQGTFVEGGINGTDGTPLTSQTTISTSGIEVTYYSLQLQQVQSGLDPLATVEWADPECFNCDNTRHLDGYYGGANSTFSRTEDRFVSGTALAGALPVGSIVTDILVDGSSVVATYADNADPTLAATGGIAVSSDEGQSYSDLSTLGLAPVAPYFGVASNGANTVVVGSNGGVAVAQGSLNSFSLVPNINFAAADFYELAWYADEEAYLLVGDDGAGNGLVLSLNVDLGLFTDITSNWANASNQPLVDIAVDEESGWVGIVGSNYFGETDDFSEFSERIMPAASANEDAIAGDCWQTVVGVDDQLFVANPCNNRNWQELTLPNGGAIVGNITDIDYTLDSGYSGYFVISTDAGNIYIATPTFPDA